MLHWLVLALAFCFFILQTCLLIEEKIDIIYNDGVHHVWKFV